MPTPRSESKRTVWLVIVGALVIAGLASGGVYLSVIRDDDDVEIRSTTTASAAAGTTPPTGVTITTPTSSPLPSNGLPSSTAQRPETVGALPPGEPMDFQGGDPALDAFADACYAGDMQACDDLYRAADFGSAYRTYGDTCAGRQPANTGRYCATVFPTVTTTIAG